MHKPIFQNWLTQKLMLHTLVRNVAFSREDKHISFVKTILPEKIAFVNHSQNNYYETSLILVARLLCIGMNISVFMLVRINHSSYSFVLLYKSIVVMYIFQE